MADIHKSFPPQGKENKAHMGSQSTPPSKVEGSPAEEAKESPAKERAEKKAGMD